MDFGVAVASESGGSVAVGAGVLGGVPRLSQGTFDPRGLAGANKAAKNPPDSLVAPVNRGLLSCTLTWCLPSEKFRGCSEPDRPWQDGRPRRRSD